MTDFCEIHQLVKLFNPDRDENSDSEEEERQQNLTSEETVQEAKKPNPYAKIENKKQEEVITDYTEDTSSSNLASDWKKTPKWNITYRQKVTASDVFLQMGGKTPATASCEDMVVTVDLPGEHMQNMDIKVFKEKLDVSSPNFSLKIPLPHPVHPQKGDAKWDKDEEKLIITLTMEREFDFVNF